jgi:hypothetical protein
MKFPRHELRHTADPLDKRRYKGGDAPAPVNSSTGSPITTNIDRRMALQDAVVLGDGASAGNISRTNVDTTLSLDGRSYTNASSTAFTDASSRDNSNRSSNAYTDASQLDNSNRSSNAYTDARNYTDGSNHAYSDSSVRNTDSHAVTYAADAMVLQTLASDMPDAMKAMLGAGADVINRAGGAVVNLNRDSIAANTASFDSVVNFGAGAIDKIINASIQTSKIGNDLAAQAVASYQPDSKNNADTAKYAMYAAAGLVALVLINGKKS